MCIKNLYQPASDEKIPQFLKENITKSINLTGDAFFLKVFGSNTKVAEVYYEEFYKKIFYKGAVDIRIKEIIRLRLAGISGCKYCISVDENSAMKNGVSEVDIFNAKNNKIDEFDDSLKNILKLVNHISLSKASERAEQEIIEQALTDFSQEQFVEILFVTAILAGMGNMLGSADLVETD